MSAHAAHVDPQLTVDDDGELRILAPADYESTEALVKEAQSLSARTSFAIAPALLAQDFSLTVLLL